MKNMKDGNWKIFKTKLMKGFKYYSVANFERYLKFVEQDLLKHFDTATVQLIMEILEDRIEKEIEIE